MGFFNAAELQRLIDHESTTRPVVVTLHRTADLPIPGRMLTLRDAADGLRRAARIIVHQRDDVRRLSELGVTENVELVPIGCEPPCALDMDEMRQSTRIVAQCLDGMPEGPWIADDRKVVLPPREELHTSMESLIHHFKIVTEGYRVPEGEVYATIESPRGELGCYVVSDGGPRPWRVKFRAPSFVALEATATCMSDALVEMFDEKRDEALRALRDAGIEAQIGTWALNHLEPYRHQGSFPGADRAFERALALPFATTTTEDEVDRVAAVLTSL